VCTKKGDDMHECFISERPLGYAPPKVFKVLVAFHVADRDLTPYVGLRRTRSRDLDPLSLRFGARV
jgi:hypothetical protein